MYFRQLLLNKYLLRVTYIMSAKTYIHTFYTLVHLKVATFILSPEYIFPRYFKFDFYPLKYAF